MIPRKMDEKQKSDGGPTNMLVSDSYATNVMKWLMGKTLCAQERPFLLVFLRLSHHPQQSGSFLLKLSTGLDRNVLPTFLP